MQTAIGRCGGITIVLQAGGHSQAERSAAVAVARPAAVAWVQLDGCLMDAWFTAAEGRIDALNARGQLVASAQTEGHGVFHLRGSADEGMQLVMREGNVQLSACLIDYGPR